MVTNQTETIFGRRTRSHTEKARSHAAVRFSLDEPLANPAAISQQLRTFLKIEDERLKIAHRCGAAGTLTAAARSSILDLVVERTYYSANLPVASGESTADARSGLAVVAVGGYGRGELAPYSDLDLLFLHSDEYSSQTYSLVEHITRLLWDAGLTVGHSFRSVADCTAAGPADPQFQTALVSSRMLAGDVTLYDSLLKTLERDRLNRTNGFLTAIRNERRARYAKFGAVVCLQEPNIKESAGGLRDFHTALWAGYARYGCRTLEELKAREIITEAERRTAARAVDFLWRVRYAVQLLTRRKTDRLALDLQTTLAREFGYEPSTYLLASEALMRDYYRHARTLYRFSDTLLGRASETETAIEASSKKPSQPATAEPFSIRNGYLELESDTRLFSQNPSLIFDAFTIAQSAKVPLGHLLQEAVRESLPLVNHKFRGSAEASHAFLRLLNRRGRGGYVLRLMHDVDFLARFMPEFERISLLIQHDLYHHYTVDEHTLKAVEELDELHFSVDKQRAHFRVIFDEIKDPAMLYLGILLHDIGKGHGRGHIARGVKIAERVCARLDLTEKQAATVVLLVKQHVLMAHIAQRRDLNEPQVISDFATQVGSLDTLNSLMLLTYADLKAVGPGVWSEWKSTLLWELYRRTRSLLAGTDPIPDDLEKLARFKQQVVHSPQGWLPISEVERHLALLPDRYVRVTGPQAAAIHINLIRELKSEVFARRWLGHSQVSTELTICTRDRHGLFADVAGTLAAHGIEIMSAELNTREDGIALDVFMLREASTHLAIDVHRYAAIERALHKSIAGESDVAAMVERWLTRHAPRKGNSAQRARQRSLPHVVCDNQAAGACTLIEIQAPDEPGLAYKMASALAGLGLDIVCAKIATEKSDALDVFYVTDGDGMKLSTTRMVAVEASLAKFLS
jgi:[protein-PII] uridylyltransferase